MTRGRPLKVWGVTVDGQPMHLAAVGGATGRLPGRLDLGHPGADPRLDLRHDC